MNVKIIENFLESSDFNKVTERLQYPANWRMQSSSGFNKTFSGPSNWAMDEDGSQQFLSLEIEENEEFYYEYLFNKVGEHVDGDCELQRIYFNGQWSGRESVPHVDGCDATALLYCSPYQYGWGGFTEIFTAEGPMTIHPFPNRLVIFPGNNMHKGYSFSYQRCPMRVTLAFKINTK
jgi:hypothetical protein